MHIALLLKEIKKHNVLAKYKVIIFYKIFRETFSLKHEKKIITRASFIPSKKRHCCIICIPSPSDRMANKETQNTIYEKIPVKGTLSLFFSSFLFVFVTLRVLFDSCEISSIKRKTRNTRKEDEIGIR